MLISSNEFSLTKKEYFRILLDNIFRYKWPVFIFLFLFSLLGLKAGIGNVVIFFIVVCIGYSLGVVLFCLVRASIFPDRFLFLPRRCEIDHEFISVYLRDGSVDKIKLTHIIKSVQGKKYFLLYLSSKHFIYLPFIALTNPTDLEAVRTLIKVRIGK